MDTHANTGEILEEMYDKVWSFESVLVPLSGEKEKKKRIDLMKIRMPNTFVNCSYWWFYVPVMKY